MWQLYPNSGYSNSRLALKGNYHGTPSRYITALEGIQDYVKDEDIRIYYSKGCHLHKDKVKPLALNHDRLAETLTVAEHSDVVFLCLGLDETLEGEEGDTGNYSASGDKIDLNLPKVQQNLLEKVVSVGKPTILLLSTGSAMSINFAYKECNAIIQTWYSGARDGQAIAECLFGEISPSGKLTVTFYRSVEELPEFTDYSMKGRTYRYMETDPLYPFGYGLTYSKVNLKNLRILNKVTKYSDIELSIEIENTGDYITDLNKAMTIVDEKGDRYIDSDNFTIFAGISQPDKRSLELTGIEAISVDISI